MPALKEFVFDKTGGRPGSALIMTPNERPGRYLANLYAADKTPGLLPKCISLSRVISIWSAASCESPYCMASTLDQIWFLREACDELARTDQDLARHFSGMPMDQFLPWGFRLVALFEEFLRQGRAPEDIPNVEGEVGPLAESLLGALGRIGALWRQKLASQEIPLLTQGLECLNAAGHSGEIPAYLAPRPDRPVFIAGFSQLDRAEALLFRSLWEQGAMICLHGAPELANGGELHPACEDQAKWIRDWEGAPELVGAGGESVPDYSFFMAYDDHSQLDRFARDFEKDPAGSRAIILPGADLLMPLLHHVPEKEINISVGYPLKRTRLHSFLDEVFRLQLHRQEDGKYYWKDLLRLFRQPFMRMLSDGKAGPRLGKPLYRLEKIISSGSKYVDLAEAVQEAGLDEREREFLGLAFRVVLDGPAAAATPGALARSLSGVCEFLIRHGGNVWKAYPLDLEALARLQNRLLPELADTRMKDCAFQKQVLFGMLESLLEQERIPFEAEPLVGAQVLGLLETRLLHFDNLYILGASDERLPGGDAPDPLFPDALRRLVRLPDARARQRAVSYNLYRLLASAKNARFYWTEGASGPDAAGGGKGRSRFVEQIIWGTEQTLGARLAPGSGPLQAAQASAHLSRNEPPPVSRGAALDERMRGFLAGRISATALNSYLGCPAQFVYERLLALTAPSRVNEKDDALAVGNCIHDTLRDILCTRKGRKIKLCEIAADEVQSAFAKRIREDGLAEKLPVDSLLMLEKAGIKRLLGYLGGQDFETLIQGIEEERDVKLTLHGREYEFFGRLDRLDERAGEAVIVDYKTGFLHQPEKDLWKDRDFFAALDAYTASHPVFDAAADTLLAELRKRLPDVQMPLYMLMENAKAGKMPAEAVYVDLGDKCEEQPLFGQLDVARRKAAFACCESAVSFILSHMERVQEFTASGEGCDYCDYQGICRS